MSKTNRRGFLKGMLGAGAGAVIAPAVVKGVLKEPNDPSTKKVNYDGKDYCKPVEEFDERTSFSDSASASVSPSSAPDMNFAHTSSFSCAMTS